MDNTARMGLIGKRAADLIPDGATVGLGTGMTADAMVDALGARVRDGMNVIGVATSSRTIARAKSVGIKLVSLDEATTIDIGIDGADEVDPHLNLLKGRGGALLYEKLVARSAKQFVVIGSSEKLVRRVGSHFPIPVEIVPFGWTHTVRTISSLGITPTLRSNDDGTPFVTDGGHYIVDCSTPEVDDPAGLASALKQITGVVEHGLFVGMCDLALTIDMNGVIAQHDGR